MAYQHIFQYKVNQHLVNVATPPPPHWPINKVIGLLQTKGKVQILQGEAISNC